MEQYLLVYLVLRKYLFGWHYFSFGLRYTLARE